MNDKPQHMNWKQAIAYARALGFEVEDLHYANGRREQVRISRKDTTKGGTFYKVSDMNLWLHIFVSTPIDERH